MEKTVTEKIAPVQGYPPGIPWHMHLRAYEAYCRRYSAQPALIDLEGRGCRGGFSTGELDMFIPGWRDELSGQAELLHTLKMLRKSIDDLQDRRMALENCDHAIQIAARLAAKPPPPR